MREARNRALLLVADDDPTSLDMLYGTLTVDEFDLVMASEGEKVLPLARSERPDLVLLDMVMPGMSGLEICRRLKEDPSTSSAPVIFMTAYDELKHRIQAFQVGAVDYISKPFEGAELLARVRTQLSLRKLTQELEEQNIRLQEEIRERTTAEAQREKVTQALLERTEELRQAMDRLKQEYAERGRAETERARLQERIIEVQRENLLALSTPLIPITQRIMVMPLIGSMDRERAERVMETALAGVATRRAAIVILDITGLRMIDESVADMLVRTSEGLRLLGARTLLTGVGPEVARTLVELGASLGSLVAQGTLQDGIAYALRTSSVSTRAGAHRAIQPSGHE